MLSILMEPSLAYEKIMATVHEKIYLSKVDSLLNFFYITSLFLSNRW